jgi:hypothetical protein
MESWVDGRQIEPLDEAGSDARFSEEAHDRLLQEREEWDRRELAERAQAESAEKRDDAV